MARRRPVGVLVVDDCLLSKQVRVGFDVGLGDHEERVSLVEIAEKGGQRRECVVAGEAEVVIAEGGEGTAQIEVQHRQLSIEEEAVVGPQARAEKGAHGDALQPFQTGVGDGAIQLHGRLQNGRHQVEDGYLLVVVLGTKLAIEHLVSRGKEMMVRRVVRLVEWISHREQLAAAAAVFAQSCDACDRW